MTGQPYIPRVVYSNFSNTVKLSIPAGLAGNIAGLVSFEFCYIDSIIERLVSLHQDLYFCLSCSQPTNWPIFRYKQNSVFTFIQTFIPKIWNTWTLQFIIQIGPNCSVVSQAGKFFAVFEWSSHGRKLVLKFSTSPLFLKVNVLMHLWVCAVD